MVVDTSALVVILRREPDWTRYLEVVTRTVPLRMSAASWVELSLVILGQLPPGALGEVDALRRRLGLELIHSMTPKRRLRTRLCNALAEDVILLG